MSKLYKSYTLNLMALLGVIGLIFFGNSFFEIFLKSNIGAGDFLAFFYIPASMGFICLLIIGVLTEYICKSANMTFAFNFPYEKISLKAIYYPFFYIGLIWGILPALYLIAGLLFIK